MPKAAYVSEPNIGSYARHAAESLVIAETEQMAQWEYNKVDLNSLPPKSSELDLLNDAGEEGWELVAITANNLAVMKRQVSPAPPVRPAVRASGRAK